MTIKLCLLKSGEDIITDLTEMRTSDGPDGRVIGYFFEKPCIVKMRDSVEEQIDKDTQRTGFEVSLFPWMPLTPETKIPVTADWLITMVEPIDNLKKMYIEDVVNYGKDNKGDSTNESPSTNSGD